MNKYHMTDSVKERFRAMGLSDNESYQEILDIVRSNQNGRVDSNEKTAIALFYWLQASLDWNTTCVNCARVLDSAYESEERRHDAEEALERLRSLISNGE
jgi:hypothetical protein